MSKCLCTEEFLTSAAETKFENALSVSNRMEGSLALQIPSRKWRSLHTGFYSEHMIFENLESNEANVPYSLPANVLVFKLQTS